MILGHSSKPVCGFSVMEQVRLCAILPMENWYSSSLHQMPGWITVRESHSRALEQGPLLVKTCHIYKMESQAKTQAKNVSIELPPRRSRTAASPFSTVRSAARLWSRSRRSSTTCASTPGSASTSAPSARGRGTRGTCSRGTSAGRTSSCNSPQRKTCRTARWPIRTIECGVRSLATSFCNCLEICYRVVHLVG